MAALVSLSALAPARAQQAALATAPIHAGSESRDARANRWKETFDQFAAEDQRLAPKPGGVVFLGSSSIRLWDGLERDFEMLPNVIRRGFGGSRLSDCAEHVARLVLPYRPKLVVIYAGDNDLAEGAAPAEVLSSFTGFVKAVREKLPETRIAYVSIKPSPLRAALMAKARDANALIQTFARRTENVEFIDVYSKMLGPDGKPRTELFLPDMLHLNRAGYALWRQEIGAHLQPLLASTAATAAAAVAGGADRAAR
jgi:lysophospholipase L1-like esterase